MENSSKPTKRRIVIGYLIFLSLALAIHGLLSVLTHFGPRASLVYTAAAISVVGGIFGGVVPRPLRLFSLGLATVTTLIFLAIAWTPIIIDGYGDMPLGKKPEMLSVLVMLSIPAMLLLMFVSFFLVSVLNWLSGHIKRRRLDS